MERVECIKCGSIGYTASPEQVSCSKCGGRHRVISAYIKVPKHNQLGMIRKG